MNARRLALLAAVFALLSSIFAWAQSSPSFRVEGGALSTSTQSSVPDSGQFRVNGGMDAAGFSGIAASGQYVAASGVPLLAEVVFRNGFE